MKEGTVFTSSWGNKLMTLYAVAAPAPLRPDPDQNSPPIAKVDPTDVLTLLLALAPWSKISVTKADATVQGWLTAELVPVQVSTVQLFDAPLGAPNETATGRVDIIAKLATWAKVKITKQDGSVSLGWTEDATRTPEPAKPIEAVPATPQAASLRAAPNTGAAPLEGPSAAPKTAPAAPEAASTAPKVPPTEDADLALGANERYRAALLQAQTITHIDAAALAALIDAEAAKIASGPDAGVWNPKSSAGASSTARGLTQFLDSTWCDMACRPGLFLNAAAKNKGLVSSDNHIAPGMFDALLDLRFDPTLSIVTAAEYGLANLTMLQKEGLVAPDIGDDDRAWYIYLAHHEGLEGAEKFLRKQGGVPFNKLVEQVGDEARANALIAAAGGDIALAYRNWLSDYMERKIQPSRFRPGKAPAGKALAQDTRALGQFNADPVPLSALYERPDLAVETQQTLSNLGYLDPPPDGLMGPTSQWALAEFCKLNDLSLDAGFTKDVAATLLNPKQLLPEIGPSGGWIDRVIAYMRKKNYFICRHPDCKNIVYVEGVDPDGKLNPQTPNAFEDLRVVFSIRRDGVPVVHDWVGTTEPGKPYTMNPMNPKGAARIAFGQFKSWRVGTHVGPTGFEPHEALIQAEPIDVYRDGNMNYKREGPIFSGIFGIDQHWGYDLPKDDVGHASAGCLVGETRDGHRAFMALIKSDPRYIANNGYKFVTAVIPGTQALAPAIA